jgi:hypothetical protein
VKAFKLCRKEKDGKVYPIFINRKESFRFGECMIAECYPTKGFAVRKGFHCCFKPYAPHLKIELKSGQKRVWIELEVEDYVTYNRPESQGGEWILANKIKPIREVSFEEVAEILKK